MGKHKVETGNPVDGLAMKTGRIMNAPQSYEIRVVSHLSANWAARFDGLPMWYEPEGETMLSGAGAGCSPRFAFKGTRS
jgi:hypothetical protein